MTDHPPTLFVHRWMVRHPVGRPSCLLKQGAVSLTATDCPTGRRTILQCYLWERQNGPTPVGRSVAVSETPPWPSRTLWVWLLQRTHWLMWQTLWLRRFCHRTLCLECPACEPDPVWARSCEPPVLPARAKARHLSLTRVSSVMWARRAVRN